MRKYALVVVMAFLGGCASSPDDITASYISPITYKDYDCDQIGLELQRVTRRAGELHGNLDKKAGADAAQTAIGAVVFWPALFFLEGGDGPDATEYARLKGEREALEQVSILKKCGVPTQPVTAATEPAKQ